MLNARDVFVNCPFDESYKSIFNAIVFTVIRSGFRMRCALEIDNAATNRLANICNIIEQCRFGIHDISRTESDGDPPLPRFNMPLELGLFLGAKRYGSQEQKAKCCIVFDRERYRFQRFVSDISGQDIHAHSGDVDVLIRELAAWFRDQGGGAQVPGGRAISSEYHRFAAELPAICAGRRLELDEMTFLDLTRVVAEYLTL